MSLTQTYSHSIEEKDSIGLEGMKYIIQMYEGEINGHRDKEDIPT